ncbi:DNA methyltransferase, partial [Acinetobacter baumannii]
GINFSYPKPNKLLNYIIDFYSKDGIVLDFFAGSGTTAQSVIELNKADKGQRKYLLVEQSEYFNSVIKPRIQKVVYSADWKEGKPINPE